MVIPIYEDDDDGDRDEFAGVLVDRWGRPYRNDVKISYLLKVAFPNMETEPNRFYQTTVRVVDGDKLPSSSATVQNLNELAIRAYEAEQGKIFLRSIVRALAKFAIKEQAEDHHEALGVLANVFNFATEAADTRNWATLPGSLIMTRFELEPGVHSLEVELYGRDGGKAQTIRIDDVRVRAGERLFLNYRVY